MGAVANAEDVSAEAMQAKFPNQYQSWAATAEQSQRQDMLANYPAAIVLWAGSSYAKEYHSPRGHHFAVADVTHTLRTGVAPAKGEKGLSASCWTCKSPDVPRLIGELGVEGFSGKNFTDLGKEMQSVVYCTDCHVKGSAELALPRPHAQEAMAKVQLPFEQQNANMQGSQVCGQCHVTYYFQPERSNRVNIPWIFGSTADLIEKYYDTRRFYEWIHPISRTPIVKARHPEFEHWSRSEHAKAGVSCISCHMPESVDSNGKSFTNHQIGQALPNYEQVCQACHSNKTKLVSKLETNKAQIEAKAREVEQLLVKAHYEAGAAWDAGASWPIMNDAIMAIRHAQWRWDFAMSSHGLYAHNPQEGMALLDAAIEHATHARNALSEILSMLKVAKVNYPDISTKASAQKAVGIELDKLTAEKKAFIEQEVDKHWPEVSRHGY
ncbi:ammonia-forming cytochrome c nitrite reductase subunit c552 [Shewanella sp. Isolate11]|uniref:ammonia-forming cytochrome c nitrite reductase subunit c552 n=1 Tax=Shewanella sp. Isolate11 TaxID=2908530 RepID=UPI001EFDCA7C|nr:ammonia-forming cytochrome c nitrite reductase subunit c552 [Shewanella sp. Isolate11]MCG9695562.1 ammonia-forming cytochrome c nitrite reductase subunit c552 [Shewanella sp. Isolate11]